MTNHRLTRGFIVLWFVFSATACTKKPTANPETASSGRSVIDVDEEDPEMLKAITEARSTLPEFWKALDSPHKGESNFALKVKVSDGKGTEHIWLTNIERKDGEVYGTLDNEPDALTSVKLGDRLKIEEKNISDWLYMRNGKMVGNQTIRPLFSKMTPEEVEGYKRMMADP
jgi:uncharacterized protein YegJ (DUF2314 family)